MSRHVGVTLPTDSGVRAALVSHLLRTGYATEVSHLVIVAAAAAMIWDHLPHLMVTGWAVAVAAATVTRGLARHEAAQRRFSPDRALRITRLTVSGLGLAWGVGSAVAISELPIVHMALLLIMLTGLVAGATTTLTADRPAFLLFTLAILTPLPASILLNGSDREHIFAVFLVILYAGFMAAQNTRAHTRLVEYFRAQVLLRESEALAVRERAYLDALFNSAPVGIVTLDLQGSIRRVNAAFERLFGYTPDEVVGRPLDAVIVPEDELPASQALQRRVAEGGVVTADLRRRRRDGSLVDVRLSASRVEAGGASGMFALYEDVTTQVAARRAIEDARDAAQRAAQARATFLANMSHEIRTPMNAILGFTELLLESELSPEQRHSLGLVQASAETLLTLIDDILDFSKIEGDHLVLESILFDLPHLVESTASLLGVRARAKRLEVLAHVEPGVPASVRGDPTRLRQVLTNLIGNAIKFTHEGEVVVAVSSVGANDGRRQVRFRVRDTGIGIAPDKLDTIFAEFSQADASMTRRYGGTGLGLAIARRLVHLMGGQLGVTSEEGRGTEFTFTLELEADETAHTQPAHPSAAHLAGRRALIVDDNATNRRIVSDMLSTAGMRIVEANSGVKALDVLRRAQAEGQPFELVVLDQQMPDLDGFAMAAAVRADRALADTRLLMLTSAGRRGDGQRCRELGIRGYLTKPASRSDLLEAAAAVVSAAPAGAATPADIVTRHSIAEARPRLRILLAEDNPVNQEVAATILRRRGHEVDVVPDGRAAVQAVASKRYDVVLMDIQMPDMDGLEATEAIRRTTEGRSVPILALTAHAQHGERERCLERGMSGYLTKPFKAHELFAMVEGWSDGAAATEPAPAEPAPQRALDMEAFRRTMREAGAEDAVPAILETFRTTAPSRLDELAAAVAGAGPDDIRRAAHTYKSAAATIGATRLAELLGGLEDAARQGRTEGARDALEHIRAAHAAVLSDITRARV